VPFFSTCSCYPFLPFFCHFFYVRTPDFYSGSEQEIPYRLQTTDTELSTHEVEIKRSEMMLILHITGTAAHIRVVAILSLDNLE
jgi:hypothetical protein